MKLTFKIQDNTHIAEKLLEQKKKQITYAWGLFWQSTASKIITVNKAVDTGRLRASLTFITNDKVGGPINRSSESKASDFLNGSSGDDGTVVVGTNVSYATYVETGTSKQRARPFVKPAIMNYKADYKNIMQNILKS